MIGVEPVAPAAGALGWFSIGPCGDAMLDRRRSAWRLALDAGAVEAITALDRAGIPSILLKGAVTAARLYPGTFRPHVDIDLLVPPGAQREAIRVLGELGYGYPADAEDLTEVGHAATLVRPTDHLCIDLHRTLYGVGIAPQAVWDLVAAEQVPFQLCRAEIMALGEAAFIAHVALHLAQTGATKPKPRLDLEQALALMPTAAWVAALQVATRLRAVGPFTAALRCGGAAGGQQMADRLGLTTRPTVVDRLCLRYPLPWLAALRTTARRDLPARVFRWFVPSAARRAVRLTAPDARRILPGAPPAIRIGALRVGQLSRTGVAFRVEVWRWLSRRAAP